MLGEIFTIRKDVIIRGGGGELLQFTDDHNTHTSCQITAPQ